MLYAPSGARNKAPRRRCASEESIFNFIIISQQQRPLPFPLLLVVIAYLTHNVRIVIVPPTCIIYEIINCKCKV